VAEHVARTRALVVEDDLNIVDLIRSNLAVRGFDTVVSADGSRALQLLDTEAPDIVLLDLMLPEVDGFELCRQMRERSGVAIIVVSARGGERDKVTALNMGADDYMTKPFDLGELIARARALIRRGKGVQRTALRVGDLNLDLTSQSVELGGRPLELSPTEYRILEYLMHHPRKVVSKRELLEHMYDFSWEHHSNVIEAHLSNLRRKLREAAESPTVENLRGRGYRLSAGFPSEP
jgi:DNA-binding response OmpR family regulator